MYLHFPQQVLSLCYYLANGDVHSSQIWCIRTRDRICIYLVENYTLSATSAWPATVNPERFVCEILHKSGLHELSYEQNFRGWMVHEKKDEESHHTIDHAHCIQCTKSLSVGRRRWLIIAHACMGTLWKHRNCVCSNCQNHVFGPR